MLHFNTSHVNVNRLFLLLDNSPVPDFNTSHVNVNPRLHLASHQRKINFNTSHVNVNQKFMQGKGVKCRISIHLMLMLIKPCTLAAILGYAYFNTSHVNVNPFTP